MNQFIDCWIASASSLFSQALAGEPTLEGTDAGGCSIDGISFIAKVSGDVEGTFAVTLDPTILAAPLLGDGIDQVDAWGELLREAAEAAAGELLATSGRNCRIESMQRGESGGNASHRFRLVTGTNSWEISVRDGLRESESRKRGQQASLEKEKIADPPEAAGGVELLLDVELEVALRFGCREMALGDLLELGPGDVVELDRHISDPVDLVVGDRIVARGDVVLVNGAFGLRVTEVAAPQKRLESIRCLF